jgi:hypothetical protein
MSRQLLVAGLVLLLVSAGCGASRSRTPVPHVLIEGASIEGYYHIRYWGDEPSDALGESFVESWQQERSALGLAPDARNLPDSNYLAISGGGEDGAFGAGVLCGWTVAGDRPTFKVVTGISTGALIAPFAFLGSEEDAMLKEVYTQVDEKDLIKFQGLLSLLRSDAAYSTAPLSKLARKYFDKTMLDKIADEHRKGRRLLIGTTNLDAGRPVIWDVGRIACSDRDDRVDLFQKVLLASAAIPGAFPPIYLDVIGRDGKKYDEMHVDGGVTREMFLLPSDLHIFELRDKSGIERQSHLYVIRNARYGPEYEDVQPRVGSIAARSVATLIKAQAVGDLKTLYYEAKENNVSYALTSIPDDFPADYDSMFDKKYMQRLFDVGFKLSTDRKAWRSQPSYDKPLPATRPADS